MPSNLPQVSVGARYPYRIFSERVIKPKSREQVLVGGGNYGCKQYISGEQLPPMKGLKKLHLQAQEHEGDVEAGK